MKKRRPCTGSQSHSPRNSPRPLHVQSIPIKSKSHHELKRRRQQRGSARQKSLDHVDNISLKKEVFSSLESLFDLKKPLTLPEIHSPLLSYFQGGEGRTGSSASGSQSPKSPRHLVPPLLLQHFSYTTELEPHIFIQPCESSELDFKEDTRKTDLEEIVEDEEALLLESNESIKSNLSVTLANFARKMSDEENPGTNEEQVLDPEEPPAENQASVDTPVQDEGKEDKTVLQDDEPLPPQYPLPPNIGEGIPVKPGAHRDSIMSVLPITDTAVMKEMNDAYERCIAIGEEIEQLRQEMAELANKEDFLQEDTDLLGDKQEKVNIKLAELDEMTRKIQRIVGLSDPSSHKFAEMFDMLPYPHQKKAGGTLNALEEEEEEKEKEKLGEETQIGDGEKEKETTADIDDQFDLPQMEYLEDRLPRVIICGNTEENIPKIVVADSQRKRTGTRHLENLTGKLSESLIMQEKLVKENAKLEGGKYKLEEALLEKDNAVDSLQRKVCGLQAEMRIVVKENTELSRQVACLNKKIATPACSFSCPGGSPLSPLSTPALPTYSYSSSAHPDDTSCHCKCCLQENIGDSVPLTSGNRDSYKCQTATPDSPRLSGGGIRENYLSASSNILKGDMSSSPRPASRGTCPAELEHNINVYGQTTKQLQEQLGCIENEVRTMQMELVNVQRERNQLDQQRKLLKCTGPCAPCACGSTSGVEQGSRGFQPQNVCLPCPSGPQSGMNVQMPMKMSLQPQASQGSCLNGSMSGNQCPQQQLRDLKEQYARLQDDYKSKLCEVSCLRSDAEKMKQETREAKEERAKMENRLIDLQERLKILEAERNKMNGSKEQLIEQEQALLVAKQRFRDAQDELEELRSLTQDQSAQLEDYRNKYLMAQQKVEEQRHQLDLMELDNARMNENVTLEIGRVKNQFQEKLAELAPLPDILKQTQLKLQESQQMRQIAERNCEDLSRELLDYKDKMQGLQKEMEILRSENQSLQDNFGHGSGKCEELEKKNSELRTENDRLKNALIRVEEQETQVQKRIDEKLHEVAQLTALLEQVREDSARQVARTKERCELIRKTMHGQISEMERQLAQCRATARAAQKDRDEIRQKMQGQINNLNEAFEHAQGRIRSLQGHVNYLKNSYSNIFTGQGQGETPGPLISGESPPQGQGYDSCDCNF